MAAMNHPLGPPPAYDEDYRDVIVSGVRMPRGPVQVFERGGTEYGRWTINCDEKINSQAQRIIEAIDLQSRPPYNQVATNPYAHEGFNFSNVWRTVWHENKTKNNAVRNALIGFCVLYRDYLHRRTMYVELIGHQIKLCVTTRQMLPGLGDWVVTIPKHAMANQALHLVFE
jgi:hypothetical protein